MPKAIVDVTKGSSFNLPRSKKSRKCCRRLFSVLAVVGTLYLEFVGSIALKRTVWGRNFAQFDETWYNSSAIQYFVDKDSNISAQIVYVDANPYIESIHGCLFEEDTALVLARLAEAQYLLRDLPGLYNVSYVLDCSYSGRFDPSNHRVHGVDAARTTLVTWTLQSLRAVQPQIHQDESCWLLSVITTNLTLLRLNPASPASQHHTFSLRFASKTSWESVQVLYVNSNEVPWTVRVNGQWVYQLSGVHGFYRGSPTTLAHSMRFMWRWSETWSPVDRISTLAYYHQTTITHTYAWIQALVVVGIWGRILVCLGVTSIVMHSNYKANGQWMFPQVFPVVQRSLAPRACLILLAMACDGFWSVKSLAVHRSFTRYVHWPCIDDATLRANLLTLLMAWTSLLATALSISISPAIVLATFLVCEVYKDTLRFPCSTADAAVRQLYEELRASDPTPGRRPFGPLPTVPWWLVIYDGLWLVIASAIILFYMVVVKLTHTVDSKDTYRRRHNRRRRNAVDPTDILPLATHMREVLAYVTPVFQRRFLSPQCGLYEPAPDIIPAPCNPRTVVLNRTALLCAGWVRLDAEFLIHMSSIPYLVINKVLRRPLFLVCGAKIVDDTLMHLECLHAQDIPWSTLVHLSVTHLRIPRQKFRGLDAKYDVLVVQEKLAALVKQDSDLATRESSAPSTAIVPGM